jgi:hypothetical protein
MQTSARRSRLLHSEPGDRLLRHKRIGTGVRCECAPVH